jgi:hypothetical protein
VLLMRVNVATSLDAIQHDVAAQIEGALFYKKSLTSQSAAPSCTAPSKANQT